MTDKPAWIIPPVELILGDGVPEDDIPEDVELPEVNSNDDEDLEFPEDEDSSEVEPELDDDTVDSSSDGEELDES